MWQILKKNKKNEKYILAVFIILNRKKKMSHKSKKTYGSDSLTGNNLGVGNGNGYINTVNPAGKPGKRGPNTRNSTKVFQSTGTINHLRDGAFVSVSNKVEDLNNIPTKDFTLSVNGSRSVERHTVKTGVKRQITSMDIHGIITRSATDGVTYGYAPNSGTPVDKPNDSAKDPWGTPPNFVYLQSAGPTVHAFNSLTSY